jgi:hypothetical protein
VNDDYWLKRITDELQALGLSSDPKKVLALAKVPGVSLDDSVPAVLATLRLVGKEEQSHKWVWQPEQGRWGLMMGLDASPVGLVFEEEGIAYWMPFSEEVTGKQRAKSIDQAKSAMLMWARATKKMQKGSGRE